MRLFGSFLPIVVVQSALAGPPYLTDDATTPPAGTWELNITGTFGRSTSGPDFLTLPTIDLNYSPLDNLQFTTTIGWQSLFGHGTADNESGPSDLDLSLKWRFLDEDRGGWRPSIAMTPHLILPTGDEGRGLGTGSTQGNLSFEFEKTFGEENRWFTFAQIGVGKSLDGGGGSSTHLVMGLALGCDVTDEWSLGVEVFTNTALAPHAAWNTTLNFVVLYTLSEKCTLGMSVGSAVGFGSGARPLIQFNVQTFF